MRMQTGLSVARTTAMVIICSFSNMVFCLPIPQLFQVKIKAANSETACFI